MPDTIRLVIAWTCVTVFVASAIITILALLNVIKLPDPKYLNRLFAIVIVAVVGTCASFFKDFLKAPGSVVITAGATNGPGSAAPKPLTNQPEQVVIIPTDLRPAHVASNLATPVPEKGWVGFKNSGAYVAKFYVNWKENGQPQSWASGTLAVGQSGMVSLNANASEIKINAQGHTGFNWANIFTLELTNGPPNKTYVVQGTTLNRTWTTDSRMP